jgi:predicted PurR-regulated permease PerM
MMSDTVSRTSIAIVAAVTMAAAAYFADTVFAPLTLAFFIIALVSPVQRWLQARMPALLALAVTMTLTIVTMLVFASLVVWGFSRVGRSLIANTGRYQRSLTSRWPGSIAVACQWRDFGLSTST